MYMCAFTCVYIISLQIRYHITYYIFNLEFSNKYHARLSHAIKCGQKYDFLMAIIVAIVLAYLAPHPTTDSLFLEKVLYGSVIVSHSPGHRDGPVMGVGSTLYELGLFSMLVLTRTGRD